MSRPGLWAPLIIHTAMYPSLLRRRRWNVEAVAIGRIKSTSSAEGLFRTHLSDGSFDFYSLCGTFVGSIGGPSDKADCRACKRLWRRGQERRRLRANPLSRVDGLMTLSMVLYYLNCAISACALLVTVLLVASGQLLVGAVTAAVAVVAYFIARRILIKAARLRSLAEHEEERSR